MRVFSAVVVGTLLGSCAPETSLIDQIRSLGELRVVTQNGPTTYYYGANERRGIEFDLAEAFADHLGVRLNVTVADQLANVVPSVSKLDAHVAAAGLSVTAERRNSVDFGTPYENVSAQLIYKMGTRRPRSLARLAGKNIEVRAGSSHVSILDEAARDIDGLEFTENANASAETLMRRVASGDIDFAVVNSNEFELLQHYYPSVRTALSLGEANQLAWALPKGARGLQEEVDKFFAKITATGELQQVLDRYYKVSRDFDFVGSRAFVRHLRDRFPMYQESFEQAAAETGIDWRLLAAIAYQESHWDAAAVSPTGVEGLMMLTVNTARMVGVDDRSDPHKSILGGARYLARVMEKFPERIPREDRLMMAIAAYNLGFGHVEDARIITESKDADKDSWQDVRDHLPLLADESWYPHLKRGYASGSVSVQYVDNVQHYYSLLEQLTGTEIFAALPESEAEAMPASEAI